MSPTRFKNLPRLRSLVAAEAAIADILRNLESEMGQSVKAVEVTPYGTDQYHVQIVPGNKRRRSNQTQSVNAAP